MSERIVMVGAGYWSQFQVEGWRDIGTPLAAIANRHVENAQPWRRATAYQVLWRPHRHVRRRKAHCGRRLPAARGAGACGSRRHRARHSLPSARSPSAST